jgi:hypothetical protein
MSVPQFLVRTAALLGEEAMVRLSRSCVAVAGLGGVGGAILTTLVRLGVGSFKIADPGVFDEPDMNRQMAATLDTMGQNKAEVYGRFITSVNPQAQVELFTDGVTDDNVKEFLDGADLLIDACDLKVEPELRLKLAAQAHTQGICDINPPILAFGAIIATQAPGGARMEIFMKAVAEARGEGTLREGLQQLFSPEHLAIMQKSMAGGTVPSNAIAVNVVGALAATEAVMILGGEAVPGYREPVRLPDILALDLVRMSHKVIDLRELLGE